MKSIITSTHELPTGQSIRITRDPNARDGESILQSAVLNKGPSWPLESLRVILDEFQQHADDERLSFDQVLNLPGGLPLKFAFRPGLPYETLPLVDVVEVPRDYRSEVLEAIRSKLTPERLAEVFAELPADAQRRVALKCFVEPPVRRRVKIQTQRRK